MLILQRRLVRDKVWRLSGLSNSRERDDLLLKYHELCRRKAAWYVYASSTRTQGREQKKEFVCARLRIELFEITGELYELYTQRGQVLGPTWKLMFQNLVSEIHLLITERK